MKSILNIDGFSIKKTLNIKGNLIDLSNPIIMGILNLTPDSFYDGISCIDEKFIRNKIDLYKNADIIDIGAESSRPYSEKISSSSTSSTITVKIDASPNSPNCFSSNNFHLL